MCEITFLLLQSICNLFKNVHSLLFSVELLCIKFYVDCGFVVMVKFSCLLDLVSD